MLALLLCSGCATVPYTPPVETKGIGVDPGQGLDQAPEVVKAPTPVYPEFAKDAGIQGTVVLHALVGEAGNVERIEVLESITGLNESAMEAVRRWEFEPALRAGQPAAAWVTVPVTFHLDAARQP